MLLIKVFIIQLWQLRRTGLFGLLCAGALLLFSRLLLITLHTFIFDSQIINCYNFDIYFGSNLYLNYDNQIILAYPHFKSGLFHEIKYTI